jgi:hypothetical protein
MFMTVINQQVFGAIKGLKIEGLNLRKQFAAIKALDELLNSDITVAGFTSALNNHVTFWSVYGTSNAGDQLIDNNANFSLNAIREEAAKQRVILSILGATYKGLKELSESSSLDLLKDCLKKFDINPADWVLEKDIGYIKTLAEDKMQAIRTVVADKVKKAIQIMNEQKANNFINSNKVSSKLDPDGCLGQEEKRILNSSAYNRLLELKVQELSCFGSEKPHPVLLKALSGLETEEKEKLLANDKALSHLLNAKDEGLISHYLGEGDYEALVAENKRLDGFKQIHNAPLAKIMAEFIPPITLDNDKIKAINEVFAKQFNENKDFKSGMKTVITKLFPNLTDKKNKENFYKSIHKNFKTILDDQNLKNNLLNTYQNLTSSGLPAPNPAQKLVLDVLLNLDAKIEYDIGKRIEAALNSNSLDDFINTLIGPAKTTIAGSPVEINKEHKAALTKRLSQSEYEKIIIEHRRWVLEYGNDVSEKKLLLENITKEWTALETNQNELLEVSESLGTLKKLSGPAFYAKVQTNPQEMLEEYTSLLEKNTLILDKLHRNSNKLQGYIETIPENGNDECKKLRQRLENQSDKLSQEIDKQSRINVILRHNKTGINGVISGDQEYLYSADDISFDLGTGTTNSSNKPLSVASFVDDENTDNKPFKLVKLQKNADSYKYNVINPNEQTAKVIGSFEQTFFSDKAQYDLKNNSTTKTRDFKIEVTAAPDSKNDTPEDKVRFYMNMALAAITARAPNLPSAKEPLFLRGGNEAERQLLMTAFMVLDKELKFGSAAIRVSVKGGKDSVIQKGWFSNNYNNIFGDPSVKELIKDKLAEAKKIISAGKETITDLNDSTMATKQCKKKLKDVKIDAALKLAQVTLDSEGPSVPTPYNKK